MVGLGGATSNRREYGPVAAISVLVTQPRSSSRSVFGHDGRLLEQVEHVAGASDIGAYPVVLTGGCTEATDSMIAKVPAITLIGLERDGFAPHWHMPSDTFDKMDEAIMERAFNFADRIIRRIDKVY